MRDLPKNGDIENILYEGMLKNEQPPAPAAANAAKIANAILAMKISQTSLFLVLVLLLVLILVLILLLVLVLLLQKRQRPLPRPAPPASLFTLAFSSGCFIISRNDHKAGKDSP